MKSIKNVARYHFHISIAPASTLLTLQFMPIVVRKSGHVLSKMLLSNDIGALRKHDNLQVHVIVYYRKSLWHD